MSLLLDENSKVVIQGFGSAGQREAIICRDYGTSVVAGVTPGKGGQEIEGFPIRNTVQEAVDEFDANVSLIFVPAPFAADAILEAVGAQIPVIICITENIPVLDMMKVKRVLTTSNSILIGPNCPGVINVGAHARAGIMPVDVYTEGNVGVISRSGTLVYEAVDQLTKAGVGQSGSIGVGGDPIIGTNQAQALALLEDDPNTAAVVLIGEIGGTAEQEAAEFIKTMNKPVVAFIAGATAPPGRRMGHAGAIISGGKGTAKDKIEKMKSCGIKIANSPAEIGKTLYDKLNR